MLEKISGHDQHYTLREVEEFNTTGSDYYLILNSQTDGTPLMDQLGETFDCVVDEMTGNDLVRFVLQSQSLDYPVSLPFIPRHKLKAERIMGEVWHIL